MLSPGLARLPLIAKLRIAAGRCMVCLLSSYLLSAYLVTHPLSPPPPCPLPHSANTRSILVRVRMKSD